MQSAWTGLQNAGAGGPPALMASLRAQLESFALGELAFGRMGIATVESLREDGERLLDWLASSAHGEMGYMEHTAAERCNPAHVNVAPFARSVIVFAMPYGMARERVGPTPLRVARYAWGRDYHNVLGRKLRRVVRWLEGQGYRARPAVDTKPVLERAWAVKAGLGFIGKNTCLIVPGIGSHVLLGVVMTDAPFEADAPVSGGCGECRACLDACPTRAFPRERFLDARRCISYLTIEAKVAAPHTLRDGLGDWVLGCDVCQDVCPYNAGRGGRATRAAFAPHARWARYSAAAVLRMDDEAFADYAQGSPLRRSGRAGFQRNVVLALANVGGREHIEVLLELQAHHDAEQVREAASYALARIRARLSARA